MIRNMNITRLSLLFVTIFMLSGCCCIFYVPVEAPKVYSGGNKIKEKNHSQQDPTTKKKDTKEVSK